MSQHLYEIGFESDLCQFLPVIAEPWQALLWECFQKPELHDLCASLPKAPEQAYLKELIYDRHEVVLWHIKPKKATTSVGYAVWSVYTTQHYIGIYLFDAPSQEPLWSDGIEALIQVLYPNIPDMKYLYTQLLSPPPESSKAFLLTHGWVEWGNQSVSHASKRQLYGLSRKDYELYYDDTDFDD